MSQHKDYFSTFPRTIIDTAAIEGSFSGFAKLINFASTMRNCSCPTWLGWDDLQSFLKLDPKLNGKSKCVLNILQFHESNLKLLSHRRDEKVIVHISRKTGSGIVLVKFEIL